MKLLIFCLIFNIATSITSKASPLTPSASAPSREMILEQLMIKSPKKFNLRKLIANHQLADLRIKYEKFLTANNKNMVAEYKVKVSKANFNGTSVLDIQPMDNQNHGKVIVYVHGGAFVLLSAASSYSTSLPLSYDLKTRVISVNYTLAPKNKIHQMRGEIRQVLEKLKELGYQPQDIALLGDSSGASLVVSTVYEMIKTDPSINQIWALILLSPWADLAVRGDSATTMKDFDPILKVKDYLEVAAKIAIPKNTSIEDPLNSVINIDFNKNFPPTLIQTGTREIFMSQSILLHNKMKSAGITGELQIFDGMWHVFQSTHPEITESIDARSKIQMFLKQHQR